MNLSAFFLIVASVMTFVAGQLLLKKAMDPATRSGAHRVRFFWLLTAGIFLMTISFFLNLGLLQRFDLSYLYPFQGLSVIIISLTAAIVLQERLTLPLAIGSALISAGCVLVSIS